MGAFPAEWLVFIGHFLSVFLGIYMYLFYFCFASFKVVIFLFRIFPKFVSVEVLSVFEVFCNRLKVFGFAGATTEGGIFLGGWERVLPFCLLN